MQDILEASSFWHDNGKIMIITYNAYIIMVYVNSGIIFHYETVTMDEHYCIDPQWMCSMLSKVVTVNEKNPFHTNGMRLQC